MDIFVITDDIEVDTYYLDYNNAKQRVKDLNRRLKFS